jgi:hypothetical protein
VETLLDLQRTHGNAFVQRLMRRKVAVSRPGDRYEQEADREADAVVRQKDASSPVPTLSRCAKPGVHRKCAQCEGEMQRHEVAEKEEADFQAMRAFTEPPIGYGFSGVRMDAEGHAARLARSVSALTFTVGRNSVFGAGQYRPEASGGKRPLAHELAHVVQLQGRTVAVPTVQRQEETGGTEPGKKEAPESEEPDHLPYDPALDPELKARFNRMVTALIDRKIGYSGYGDMRTRQTAHVVSTAHHIYQRGGISLEDLRALPDGKDADGNVWYRKAWETVPTWGGWGTPRPATGGEIWQEAQANAFALAKQQGEDFVKEPWRGPATISCAYEGYDADNEGRKPNVREVPLSNHVVGKAIDLTIDWSKLGGDWSEEANEFVASFGLIRPFSPDSETYCIKERWHFELGPGEPSEEQPPVREIQKITNTENVRLVREPEQWDEEAFIFRRLPKGTRVEFLDEGAGETFNNTAPEYRWWWIEVDGVKGWVMQVLLDDVTGSP